MKLIDLLVRELPKCGGWRENWVVITQDSDGYLCCWSYDNPKYNGFGWEHMSGRGLSGYFLFDDDDGLSCDNAESIVTRNQYQSALAASQKVEWYDDGLPSVGCECEWHDANVGWLPVTIKYISEQIVVMESPTIFCGVHELTEIAKDIICDKPQFRPLRTEADKKREAILDAIYGALTRAEREHNRSDEAEAVYEAIAAGKIPGVKLED